MVEIVDIDDDLEELAINIAQKLDEGRSIVIRGNPRDAQSLIRRVRDLGGNWLKLVYSPLWDNSEKYVNYAKYLEMLDQTRFRVLSNKKLSRRVLLKRMAKATLDYMDVPLVDSECAALEYCSLCALSCPVNAIERGKPVKIDEGKCVECGLCVNSCPVGFLQPPRVDPYGISMLMEGTKELVIVPLSRLHEIDHGTILMASEGAIPLIVILEAMNKGIKITKYGLNLMEPYLRELEKLNLSRKEDTSKIWRFNEYASREASLIASMLSDEDKWIDLEKLNYFKVHIDEECTLCGACAEACPSRALRIRRDGDNIILEFSHQRCIGCNACVSICPEKAISIRRAINPHLLKSGNFYTVTSDEIARCKRCGRPLDGTKKMLTKLEERIRMSGREDFAKMIWYCRYCKDEMMVKNLFE